MTLKAWERGQAMPLYEYHCEKCSKDFSARLSFEDYDRKKVTCPHCKSRRVRQLMHAVNVKTSKTS